MGEGAMKRRGGDVFFSMITNRNREIYKGGEKNMLNNMSVGGYILAVFGIKE